MAKYGPKPRPLLERIVEKLVINELGCWIWTGSISTSGYGKVLITNSPYQLGYVHRVVYEIAHGPIEPGKVLMHRCDDRRCCCPLHLSVGTHKENTNDCLSKGRMAVGERAAAAKLTSEAVQEIRDRYTNGESQGHLAAAFGVRQQQISRIVNRLRWKHV